MARDHPTIRQDERGGRRRRKRMRKTLVVLAVLASLCVMGGAGAATASAANCQAFVRPTVYTGGHWEWQPVLDNCTGVNAVQFIGTDSGQIYMVDTRDHSVHFSYGPRGGTIIYATAPQYRGAPYANNVWGQGCGFPAFGIYKAWAFRIRNSNGSTWGNVIPTYGPIEQIC